MAAGTIEQPLIVIAGPTASGKTSLAIELAKEFDGEIVCADSRTVYKGMDIGTAKPSLDERAIVPHWGLDLVEPGERFTAADFKRYATNKIAEIRQRGKVPLLVGGTGLYIDAIVFDYQFGNPINETKRKELESLDIEQLHEYCEKNNILLPENKFNKRYVIRAIERQDRETIQPTTLIDNCIIVGIATNRDELRHRIILRSEQLFENDVVEEATRLGKKYGWKSEAMTGNIYPLVYEYLSGSISYSELKDKFITADWRLAKRQLTWLKRSSYVTWLSLSDARSYLVNYLANEHKS